MCTTGGFLCWPARAVMAPPMNVQQRKVARLPSGKEVRCTGRAVAEYLVQLQWVRAMHPDGAMGQLSCWVRRCLSPMGRKCTAWRPPFGSSGQPCEGCHTGAAIEHFSWGRAGNTASERMFRQQGALERSRRPALPPGNPWPSLEELDHRAAGHHPCASHDCHNGFRWSVRSQFGNRLLLSDC